MLKIVLYSVYYLVMLGAPLSLSIIFPDARVLDLTSAVPILVFALMVWQAYGFKTRKIYAEDEAVRKRQKDYLLCITHAYLIFAPLNFPLIFFLKAWGKSLSLIPVLGAAIAGTMFYKSREKKRAKAESESAEE